MIFRKTSLAGVFLVDIEPASDERGFFARTWCRREFAEQGLVADLAQASISYSARAGTLRGLHFQRPPHGETKLVRCTAGIIWDVVVDLRPSSPSFRRWQGFELAAESRRSLYVPEGFAHGFQTLTENCEVCYQISAFHAPEAAAGYRYDDPAFAVRWPRPVSAISARDRAWPDFSARDRAWPDFALAPVS